MARKILVIDDDRTFTMLIEEILSAKGYDVITESDGVQGLSRARSESPDLILLDVLMPGMTGYDFLQSLRKIDDRMKAVPVIVMSSRRSMKEFFASWDVAFFLIKPFHPNELAARVEFALGLEPAEGKASAGVPDLSPRPAEKKRKALWVGYDEALQEMAIRELAARDFEVYTAANDIRAFEDSVHSQPNVIFCQFHKVKGIMNAAQLFQKLRARDVTQGIPFVLVCHQDLEQEAVKAFDPVPLSQLSAVILYTDSHDAYKKLLKFISAPLPLRR